MRQQGVIAGCPDPDLWARVGENEPFVVLAHKQVRDFEMDSYGATAGYMTEGTLVVVLKKWNVTLDVRRQTLLKIRGLNENGRQITGWVKDWAVTLTETKDEVLHS